MIKISKEDIEFLLNNKLITLKASTNYPELSVIKYSRKVFYDRKWNAHPLLINARGLVVDRDLNVVVRPFDKVFNRNEVPDADIPGNSFVKCVRKVNGFMAAMTYNEKYGWIYSTTGSLDSDFVGYMKEYLTCLEDTLAKTHNTTYLFEICHPLDPHIVIEECGAYLIGHRLSDGTMSSECVLDAIAKMCNTRNIKLHRPESFLCKMREVNDILKKVEHEGFMVLELDMDRIQTGKVIKMKSPYYLIRKMIARKQDLNAALVNAKKAKENLDEELYCIVDAVDANRDLVQAMNEQERLEFMTQALLKSRE